MHFFEKIAQSSTLRSLQLVHNSNQLIANNLGSLVHLEHLVNLEHNKKAEAIPLFLYFYETFSARKPECISFSFRGEFIDVIFSKLQNHKNATASVFYLVVSEICCNFAGEIEIKNSVNY